MIAVWLVHPETMVRDKALLLSDPCQRHLRLVRKCADFLRLPGKLGKNPNSESERVRLIADGKLTYSRGFVSQASPYNQRKCEGNGWSLLSGWNQP